MRRKHDEEGDKSSSRPTWISDALIEETMRVYQPRYQEPLTEEDAVAMLLFVGALYDLFGATGANTE